MKRTIFFALSCLYLLFTVGASAEPVTPKRARTVAGTFWQAVAPQDKSRAALELNPTPWNYDGIYLFSCPTGGWVMVAADDASYPILAYSTTGSVNPAHLPVQLDEWLTSYQQQIEWLRANDGLPYAASVALWSDLQQGIAPAATKSGSLAPLLTTHWDQDAPYNEMTPYDNYFGNTYTGCAATAQAQMMKYWNHPAIGIGSHSYDHPRYGQQSADFGHTAYAWSQMPDQPTVWSPEAERHAVAQLMYHVGVSLEMVYGTADDGGSGALGLIGMPGYASIDNSLKDYFGYSHDMYPVFRDYGYTDEEWRDLLIAELDLHHPIIYTGAAEQGGHGFVCDGYDERGYLHFNFGWSGIGDGFYRVDSISPGHGGAGGNVTYTFNLQNAALIGAVPEYSMRITDTLFLFDREGGIDSFLFAPNYAINTPWNVNSSASWLTVEQVEFNSAFRVRLSAAPNDGNEERTAYITFTQGGETLTVKAIQSSFNVEDMCPLTVTMEATHGSGWDGGAYLSLESLGGYIFGIARLESGTDGEITIPVAPHDVRAVWHSGGGTDRYINYAIRNQHNETLVDIEYAYLNAGTHFIEWPCAHVGIDPQSDNCTPMVEVYPNPAYNTLHIKAEGTVTVEMIDVSGHRMLTTNHTDIDLSELPAGAYFVRLTTPDYTTVKRIVKR